MSKAPKLKTCKICSNKFTQIRNMQPTCTKMDCMVNYADKTLKKSALKQQKVRNKAIKEFKDNDKSEVLKKAVKEFNSFIRLRDSMLPCISCRTIKVIKYDAGHYRPAGGYSYLRFDESNCHKQCTVCNTQKSANLIPYRQNLIIKIGIEEVERLEQPNQLKTWTVEELQQIITTYRKKIKDMKHD